MKFRSYFRLYFRFIPCYNNKNGKAPEFAKISNCINLCKVKFKTVKKGKTINNNTHNHIETSLSSTRLLILAEGITEEILLTAFSNAAGLDFDQNGIKVISSGGKNKILKQYDRLRKEANFQILMIFDSDGLELAEKTKKSLRRVDDIYVIPQGEFEDILPEDLICRAINSHYRLFGEINTADIEGAGIKSHILERLWQKKGFGKFRKAEFAAIVAGHISNTTCLSTELETLFSKINNMLSA